ncbi:NAD(P)-binding protein [Saccharata proteae CBS 121410]|uniref:NAD(P)-binding protein n=1 Tax=Saccharata proteae CBS 121410 TaxID=1314787 RepID=A0A9P4HTI3_9PEZI|nr:NAD(P)-binding protein [Saccharata proteae CBS 121410]
MSANTNNPDFQLGEVFNVKNKVALVTGGGSGIGLMCTQALAVNGAKVYIVGRTKEKLDQVVKVHGQNIAGEIIPIVGDVTDKDGVEKLVKEIESREKCLCILINNAGIAAGKTTPDGENAEEMKKNLFGPTTVNEWTDVYSTNVVGPYLMTTAFLPLLQKATDHQHGYSGCVINITSISGHVRISQGHFSYNASKGAAVHLNKMLAAEIAKAGLKIRVNSIAPGVFPSEMTTQDSDDQTQKSSMPKEAKGELPAGRPGNDRDMAAAVLFAASCQYLNGQEIPVDGGYLIQVGR